MATGLLGAVVVGGYMALVPSLSSGVAGVHWPAPMAAGAQAQAAVRAAPVQAAPTSGTVAAAPAAAARQASILASLRGARQASSAQSALLRYTPRTAPRSAVRQHFASSRTTVVRAASPHVSQRPVAGPAPKPRVRPVEVVTINVPSLAGDPASTTVDEPVTAGSGGG